MRTADSYLKTSNKRERQRRGFAIGIIILSACGLSLAGVAWGMQNLPLFRVDRVTVVGSEHIDAESVRAVALAAILNTATHRLLGAGNMLSWSGDVSGSAVRLIPQAKAVSLKKSYISHEVTLTVTEREPVGIWCFDRAPVNADARGSQDASQIDADSLFPERAGGESKGGPSTSSGNDITEPQNTARCYWFDESGVLFERAPGAEGSVLRVVHDGTGRELGIGAAALEPRFLKNIFSISDALAAAHLPVRALRVDDLGLQEVSVELYEGPRLYFSLRFPADQALGVVRLFMEKGAGGVQWKYLEYVDFRVENRVYYK